MTEDDHGKAVNIKVNGKLYTDHGAVVSATPIDNAIGDRGCDFHTGTFEFNPGDNVILCSDGMYNSSTFGKDVLLLLNQADPISSIKSISTTDDDDNSLLILRRNANVDAKTSLRELMDNFGKYKAEMPFNALIDRFSDELETMLDASPLEVADIVAFMKEKQLYPDKARIDRVFKKALGRWKAMPEGEEKQRFNKVCAELKDILKWVFTH